MFKCVECGHIFEDGEQEYWTEEHGEKMSGCPLCKGDFEEIEPCKICGGYGHDIEEESCEECVQYVKHRLWDLIYNNFTKEEQKLIQELYEGDWQ